MRCLLSAVLMLAAVVAGCGGDDLDVQPVDVTGTEVCTRMADDVLTASYECVDETSDERVSGAADVTVVLRQASPPTDMFGTFELRNDGGSWFGDWNGVITADDHHIAEGVLKGTGDYEGLEYKVRWEGDSDPLTITGTIRPSE
jgi:hypothetical protein